MDREISNREVICMEHNSSVSSCVQLHGELEKCAGSGNGGEEKVARRKPRQCKKRKPYRAEYASMLEKHMDPDQPGGAWSFYSFAGKVNVSHNTLLSWLSAENDFRAMKEKCELKLNKKR